MDITTSGHLSGYLYKRTGMMLWNKRFFQLTPSATPLASLKSAHDRHVIIPESGVIGGEEYASLNHQLFDTLALATVSGNGLLIYSEAESATSPLDIIDLSQVRKYGPTKLVGRPHVLQIKMNSGRTFYLSASSKDELQTWRRGILFFRKFVEEVQDTDPRTNPIYLASMKALESGKAFSASAEEQEAEDGVETADIQMESAADIEDVINVVTTEDQEGDVKATIISIGEHGEDVGVEDSTDNSLLSVEGDESQEPVTYESLPVMTEATGRVGLFSLIFPCASGSTTGDVVADPQTDDNLYNVSGAWIRQGWLLKKSDFLKHWNARYFVLQASSIGYFRPSDVPVDRFAACLSLTDGFAIKVVEDTPYAFELRVAGHAPMILAASDQEAYDGWVDALAGLSISAEARSLTL